MVEGDSQLPIEELSRYPMREILSIYNRVAKILRYQYYYFFFLSKEIPIELRIILLVGLPPRFCLVATLIFESIFLILCGPMRELINFLKILRNKVDASSNNL